MDRYEFGSPPWIDKIHDAIRRLLSGVDLSGVEYSSSEEYLDPPAHLQRDGGLGWHLIVSNGELKLGHGPLRTAQRQIRADYTTIRPLAAVSYRDNPEGEEIVKAQARSALEQGLLSVSGDKSPATVFPQLAPLHDLVADFTATA